MKTIPEFTIQFGILVQYSGQDTTVEIPSGTTCIGRRAFYQRNIVEVDFPVTVTEIESEAFGNTSLKNVIIRGNIAKVGAGAFPKNRELNQSVFCQIPISSFSKTDREYVVRYFIEHADENLFDNNVRSQNLVYIGKNIAKPFLSGVLCDTLMQNEALFYEVINSSLVSQKDLEYLIGHLNEKKETSLVAALLSCTGGNGKTNKRRTKVDLELSDNKFTVADWRKLYRFKYTDGNVEIIGCMIQDDIIEIPQKIGKKEVRVLGCHAFDGHNLPDRESFKVTLPEKRKIIIPEGVTGIKTGAFYCINNREIWLPKSIRELPEGMLVAVSDIVLYVPKTISVIPDELVWDSLNGSVVIQRVE